MAVGIWGASVVDGVIGSPFGVVKGIADGTGAVDIVDGTVDSGNVVEIGNEVGTVVVRGFRVGR